MKRKLIVSVALLLALFFLTGCWDYSEPEDVGIVTVLGINFTEQNLFEIIVEDKSLVPQGQLMSQKSNWSFDIHKSTGLTITDALQNNARLNTERSYLAHIKAIIISEELVGSQGLRPIIDFLNRYTEVRSKTFFLISKHGEFEKLFLPNAKYNKDTGEIIERIIKEKKYNAFILESRLGDLIELYWGSYSTPYALGVDSAQSDINNENIDQGYDNVNVTTFDIDVGDIAVFKNDKLAGWLTRDESRGFLCVMGKARGGFITVEYEGKLITLKILHLKSGKKPVFNDKKMEMKIKIDVEADVVESLADVNFDDNKVANAVEQTLNQKITKEISDAFKTSKSLSTDVFGFGKIIHGEYPNYWKSVADKWPDFYSELQLDIQVNSVIQHFGLSKRPAKTV